jgi:hypothetical protein
VFAVAVRALPLRSKRQSFFSPLSLELPVPGLGGE